MVTTRLRLLIYSKVPTTGPGTNIPACSMTVFLCLICAMFVLVRYVEQLSAIPAFASLGPLFKSSPPVELTESETEYVVRCVKHTFLGHIVMQVRLMYYDGSYSNLARPCNHYYNI